MALELVVLWAGRRSRDRYEELCEDYRERISHWVPVRETIVRSRSAAGDPERLRDEATALRAAVPRGAWTVALDRQGEAISSRELASRVGQWKARWPHPVAFLLGSDLGLDRELLAECRQVLSLGPLTLPHAIARLVLFEQLYRALSIDSGLRYHRELSDGS
ncbi:MAG: 23S rRNA (pseudouridine(1915)-N(3))-methyltransferase RlmH [Holophagales bacterium]|nr:MAG: 23S rRNA (pseudouridine(1915)-N(3))-methyltransferase RlmH [Holophagales bacterium]